MHDPVGLHGGPGLHQQRLRVTAEEGGASRPSVSSGSGPREDTTLDAMIASALPPHRSFRVPFARPFHLVASRRVTITPTTRDGE
jgi:hypothetical protein